MAGRGAKRWVARRRRQGYANPAVGLRDNGSIPKESYVAGVRQEDDLDTAEWLRRCGLGKDEEVSE